MFLATLMFPNRWAPTSSMVPLSRPAMDFTATSALLPSDGAEDEGAAVELAPADHFVVDEESVALRPAAAALAEPRIAELEERVLAARPHPRVGQPGVGGRNLLSALIAVQFLGRGGRLRLCRGAGTGGRHFSPCGFVSAATAKADSAIAAPRRSDPPMSRAAAPPTRAVSHGYGPCFSHSLTVTASRNAA